MAHRLRAWIKATMLAITHLLTHVAPRSRLTLADLLSLLPLRGCRVRSRSGSGLTANRINLPYASELYPAFNISSRFSSTSALL